MTSIKGTLVGQEEFLYRCMAKDKKPYKYDILTKRILPEKVSIRLGKNAAGIDGEEMSVHVKSIVQTLQVNQSDPYAGNNPSYFIEFPVSALPAGTPVVHDPIPAIPDPLGPSHANLLKSGNAKTKQEVKDEISDIREAILDTFEWGLEPPFPSNHVEEPDDVSIVFV